MSGNLNKIMLIGRVGKDPEIRTITNGGNVASFSLAVSESYKDKSGQKQEKTEWFNLVAFGKLADIIGQYLKKGSSAYFEGKLTTRSWDGPDGKKQYRTEVKIDQMQMLGGKAEKPAQPAQSQYVESDSDSLPF